jgi:hypothetical protein
MQHMQSTSEIWKQRALGLADTLHGAGLATLRQSTLVVGEHQRVPRDA